MLSCRCTCIQNCNLTFLFLILTTWTVIPCVSPPKTVSPLNLWLLNCVMLKLFYNLLWNNIHGTWKKLVTQTIKYAKAGGANRIMRMHHNSKVASVLNLHLLCCGPQQWWTQSCTRCVAAMCVSFLGRGQNYHFVSKATSVRHVHLLCYCHV